MRSRCFNYFIFIALLLLTSCKREARQFDEVSTATNPGLVRQSDLQIAGGLSPLLANTRTPYDENAYAMSEGKRLFDWFNCSGCHAHGGGGMGPALIDDEWIYGRDPSQVFNTIAEGRPNGMPSFAQKIQEQQIWQLVSYVRSMSGAVPRDAAPGRNDDMQVNSPESRTKPQPENKVRVPSQ